MKRTILAATAAASIALTACTPADQGLPTQGGQQPGSNNGLLYFLGGAMLGNLMAPRQPVVVQQPSHTTVINRYVERPKPTPAPRRSFFSSGSSSSSSYSKPSYRVTPSYSSSYRPSPSYSSGSSSYRSSYSSSSFRSYSSGRFR